MSKQEETRDRVLDLIEGLEVGDPIPAERQLAAELGVSRLTVRAALDDLVRDGYLERRHGSGTYVTEPKIAQPLTLTSFSDDMRRRGMTPGSRTLELAITLAGARLAHRLGVSPETRLVRVTRLRLADSKPMALEILHVPESLVPGLSRQDFEDHSFYELLRERYGITIGSGTQSIEPTVTNEEESEVLGVPLHTPAFLFERTTVSESGRTVEFVRSIYRGDRYRLVADLVPQRSRNGRSAGATRGRANANGAQEGDHNHGAKPAHSRQRGKFPG
ncbi:MAG TPA: GntR family transcriptional regulator [Candidatus Dormibacteraeota bacterium]|nr:GntR family transcriptional regulator [Candidatus Dormibacteraeota bacterium]